MRFLKRSAVAATLCAAALLVSPSREARAAPVTVPMSVSNNHVYIDVLIDGTGPYHFVLDSGSPFGLLDSDLATRLGLRVADRGRVGGVGDDSPRVGSARVRSLSIGGREIADRTFVVTPLRQTIGAAEGRPIDGVIGADLFASVVTTIDYGRDTVTLDDDVAARERHGATVLPLRLHDGLPQVACRVDDVRGRCTVDTGSRLSVTVLAPFVLRHPTVAPADPSALGVDGFGLGGAAYGRLALLPTLALGGFTLRDTVCDFSAQKRGAFADPATAANVGGGVWRRFVVTFDFAGGRLALSPGSDFGATERIDRSGLFLVGDETGTIEVLDARADTPAADAGIASGDTIVASDGAVVVPTDLPALRRTLMEPAGTTVTLRVARDGVPRDVTLTLRDFVR